MQESHQPNEQRWFDVDEAAIHARCSPQTIRSLIHKGELPAARLGNNFRLDREDLDRLLERRKTFHAPYRRGSRPWVAQRHARNRKRAAR